MGTYRAGSLGRSPILIRNGTGGSPTLPVRVRASYSPAAGTLREMAKTCDSRTFKLVLKAAEWIGRMLRAVEIDDQVEACRRIFASDTRWTVVRGSDLEEGESQGLPVWSRHVGDPILASNIAKMNLRQMLLVVMALFGAVWSGNAENAKHDGDWWRRTR